MRASFRSPHVSLECLYRWSGGVVVLKSQGNYSVLFFSPPSLFVPRAICLLFFATPFSSRNHAETSLSAVF